MLFSTVCSHAGFQLVTLFPPGARSWLYQERKQEILAIAGLLCTLWEIMGTVQRGRDAPGVMFHISTSHNITSTLSGQETAFPVISPSSSSSSFSSFRFSTPLKLRVWFPPTHVTNRSTPLTNPKLSLYSSDCASTWSRLCRCHQC